MIQEEYASFLQELQFNCVKEDVNKKPEWRNVGSLVLASTKQPPTSITMQLPFEPIHSIRFFDRKYRKIPKISIKYTKQVSLSIYTENNYRFTYSCHKRDVVDAIKIEKPKFSGDLKIVPQIQVILRTVEVKNEYTNVMARDVQVKEIKGKWNNLQYKTIAGVGLAGLECRYGLVVHMFPQLKVLTMHPVKKPELQLHEKSIQTLPRECILSSSALKRIDLVEALHNSGWELIENPEWKSESCLLEMDEKSICVADFGELSRVEVLKLDALIVENFSTAWEPKIAQYRSSGVEETIRVINELTRQ